MFIRYYIELSLPVATVKQALVNAPAGWLSAMAGEAQARGDGLLGEVGVGPLSVRLRRQVRIRLGEPVQFPSMTSLPLTWEPVRLEGAPPPGRQPRLGSQVVGHEGAIDANVP